MIPLKSAKPATKMVSGLRKSEQLGGELRFQANPQCPNIQAVDISGSLEFALKGREVIRAEITHLMASKPSTFRDGSTRGPVAYLGPHPR